MKLKLRLPRLNIRSLITWFRSVKSKLILAFAVILLLPSLSIGVISYITAKNKVDDQMKQAASESIDLLNQTITQMIDAKMKDIDFLAQQISAGSISSKQGNGEAKVREMLEKYKQLHPEIKNVFVGTEAGTIIRPSDSAPLPPDYDPRKRSWYIKTMENKGKVVVSDPDISSTTNKIEVTIAKVVIDGYGVVGADLRMESLSDIVAKVNIGKEGYVILYDAQRKYLVHPTAKIGDVATGGTVDKRFGSDTGAQEYINAFDGKLKKDVFVTNPLTSWKLTGTWYADEVTQEAAPIFWKTTLVLAVALAGGAVIVFFMVRVITTPLRRLTETSRKISEGDLSRRVEVKEKDEFGQLGETFNHMVDSLRTVLLEVSQSSSQVAASAQQLSASAEQTSIATEHIASLAGEMAEGANQQVHLVEEGARTIRDVSATIQEIAASAKEVANTATKAAEMSSEGGRAIQTAAGQMHSINGSVDGVGHVIARLANTSKEIGQITKTITEIAQQTNLLSLNAAIEAARAGEHGRGFAVVAGEVKKLAEQSSESAEQIAALIQAIRSEIGEAQNSMQSATKEVSLGMEVVHTAGSLFSEIERIVDEVGSQVQEVSAASQQISAGASQVVQSIEGIAGVAQSAASGTENVSAAAEEQLASMEEISASSAALTNLAEELQVLVDKFKL
ncbi:methyl-accepting chemotaxis protein [Cohnella sp.]|uniref:methyl-accepting chemotaxis protein n=1 Tax=Cohnella sp. TaxID=1883426 RepID=UPI0035645C76